MQRWTNPEGDDVLQVLDDQGRLLGKVNIIDAGVLVILCLLIPLAYGAYLLFRAPQPRIVTIEPTRVPQGTAQVTVRGEHLRPYLRMTVGSREATLLFETSNVAVLRLPAVEPGAHDLVLYDEAQEVARLPGGLVVEPPSGAAPGTSASAGPVGSPTVAASRVELLAIGTFRGLPDPTARALYQSLRSQEERAAVWGRVAGVQPTERNFEYLRPDALPISDGTSQVRAVLRLRCVFEQGECRLQNVAVAPGATIPIDVGGRTAQFRVDELHPIYDGIVDLQVRAVMTADIASQLAGREGALETFPAREALRPKVVSVNVVESSGGDRTVMVRLRVPIVKTPDAWLYRGRPLRLGDEFIVDNRLYTMRGSIVSLSASEER